MKNEKNPQPSPPSTPPLSKPWKQTQKTLSLLPHTWKQTHRMCLFPSMRREREGRVSVFYVCFNDFESECFFVFDSMILRAGEWMGRG